MDQVCAVVVTFNPDQALFEKALCAVTSQVDRVYVVDNGSARDFIAPHTGKVETIFLGENKGIASGFNAGISRARKDGYRYVLLLDQDSVLPDGMIARCLNAVQELGIRGVRVSAVGPRYRDRRTGHTSRFVRYRWLRNVYAGSGSTAGIVAADFLISSGSFYELAVFEEVGLFDEKLFIDHVDTEWFHRAARLGFRAFGLWDVVLEHALGEKSVRLWIGRWRQQPLHKPFRLYYIVRNSLLMYRMPHIPWKWISADIFRLTRLIGMYLCFSSRRLESIIWIHRGLRDGVQGTNGPLREELRLDLD